MRNIGIFSLLFLLVLSSCREDIRISNSTENTPDPIFENYSPLVDNVTAGVVGFVVDENNTPVPDAVVSLNGITLTTDSYGHFFVRDEVMNSLGTLVKVQKDGFFEGSRRFFPIEGQESRVKIQLIEQSFDQSFEAVLGGTISVEGGASIDFPANVIMEESGALYTGQVFVATKWMDPSRNETLDQMPGNLQGLNRRVEETALGTYGMIAVELQGSAGEALNIVETGTATLRMPVPSNMLNGAPSEIPLWSYYEELGLWIEESSATLENGSYVGEVSHFSFWNCDIPFDYVNLQLMLVDEDGNPLNNYLVTLTINNSNTNLIVSGSGYTDQDGKVSGAIPAGETLTMEIFDACGSVLSSQDIGPYTADTDLGTITVSGTTINSTTITGNLLDCMGMPLSNGLVLASFDGQNIYHYTTGSNFSTTFTSCAGTTDIEVIGIDLDNLEQSSPLTVSANTTTDLGDITVCGNTLENFLTITIDGTSAVYANPTASSSQGTFTYIEVPGPNQQYYIGFGFEGVTTGSYPDQAFIEVLYDINFGWDYHSETLAFTSFEITQYDTFIVGSFEGEAYDNEGNTLPVSCSFSIEL